MGYAYQTLTQFLAQLSLRLDDPNNIRWTQAELTLYLQEALRTWQALTGYWRNRFTFNLAAGVNFYDLTQQANSLISYNLTDSYLLSVMLYHLIESQISGGAYVGTDMFSAADFANALQNRRNQFLEETGMVLGTQLFIWPNPGQGRAPLLDSTIDVRRAAWFNGVTSSSTLASDTFTRANENPLNPSAWTVVTGYGALQVVGNHCEGTSTAQDCFEVYSGAAFPKDQFCEIIIGGINPNPSAAADVAALVRVTSGTGYAATVFGPLGPTTQISLVNVTPLGQGDIELARFVGAVNPGDVLTLRAVGSTLTVTLNGTVVISFTDTTYTQGSPAIEISDALSLNLTYISYFSSGSLTQTGGWSTVWRSSEYAARAYSPNWALSPSDPPSEYSIAAEPPVSIQLIPPPLNPGAIELLTVNAGATLNPLTGVLLGIPDNLSWVVKWGALADLLGKEGQAHDPDRAKYCEQRFREGIQIARIHTSIVNTLLNGVQVFTNALNSLDSFTPSWQNDPQGPPVDAALASWNMFVVHPAPDAFGPYSAALDVVQNAPVPVNPTDQIQVGREELDVIIDYCVHLADFKEGGGEFLNTTGYYDNLLRLAGVYNERLKAAVDYEDEMGSRAIRDEILVPRRVPVEQGG